MVKKNNKNIDIKNKLIRENVDEVNSPVIDQMENIDCELVIFLFFNDNLIGILGLGERNSENIYTKENINLLESFGNQAAIALSNAMIYDDLKKVYLKMNTMK